MCYSFEQIIHIQYFFSSFVLLHEYTGISIYTHNEKTQVSNHPRLVSIQQLNGQTLWGQLLVSEPLKTLLRNNKSPILCPATATKNIPTLKDMTANITINASAVVKACKNVWIRPTPKCFGPGFITWQWRSYSTKIERTKTNTKANAYMPVCVPGQSEKSMFAFLPQKVMCVITILGSIPAVGLFMSGILSSSMAASSFFSLSDKAFALLGLFWRLRERVLRYLLLF